MEKRANASRLVLTRDGRRIGPLAERVDCPQSPGKRMLGLLVRPPLEPEEALWLAPCGGIHTWAMGYAIDVLFLSPDHHVLGVARGVRPWRMVFAPRGTRSVIELRAGAARQVEIGDQLISEA